MTISGSFMDRTSGTTSVTVNIHPGGFYCFYHPEGKLLALNDTLQFTNFSATEPVEFEYLLAGTDSGPNYRRLHCETTFRRQPPLL